MRGVHVLAFCAVASIGSAANAQEIDWKKVDDAIGRSAADARQCTKYKHVKTTHGGLLF